MIGRAAFVKFESNNNKENSMRRITHMGGWLSVALVLHGYSGLTLAQAPADQIARLGKG